MTFPYDWYALPSIDSTLTLTDGDTGGATSRARQCGLRGTDRGRTQLESALQRFMSSLITVHVRH